MCPEINLYFLIYLSRFGSFGLWGSIWLLLFHLHCSLAADPCSHVMFSSHIATHNFVRFVVTSTCLMETASRVHICLSIHSICCHWTRFPCILINVCEYYWNLPGEYSYLQACVQHCMHMSPAFDAIPKESSSYKATNAVIAMNYLPR